MLGMENVHIPTAMIQDEKEFSSPGFGRDPERTPMQWDATSNAGFTTGEPWLPLEDLSELRNVERERNDPHSMLSLYKSLLTLRINNAAMREGDCETVNCENEHIFAFTRTKKSNKMLILINFSDDEQIVSLPFDKAEVVITSTKRSHETITFPFTLQPNEACVVILSE
jgi:alpha-glucosidase